MCVLIFSTNFVPNLSHSNKNSPWYCDKCTFVFMWSTGYSCEILIKLQFSGQIFEKYWNIKFHGNPSSGSRVVTCRLEGHADRHDEADSQFFSILWTYLKLGRQDTEQAVGWGTALQTGRWRVRFPMVSMEFFIDLKLPASLRLWGRLGLVTGTSTVCICDYRLSLTCVFVYTSHATKIYFQS
jgi:hypothetical protein